ncbi:MAG: hypothetical protein F6J87_07070 [Spirulina sp. SIO3F2]|nr:hypothetical protein [Spirulina sp. SIO3F2]
MNKQNLPVQSAPVTRYVSPGAVNGGAGVEASSFWDTLEHIGSTVGHVAKVALPIAGQVAQVALPIAGKIARTL